jgi:hypothetical protein
MTPGLSCLAQSDLDLFYSCNLWRTCDMQMHHNASFTRPKHIIARLTLLLAAAFLVALAWLAPGNGLVPETATTQARPT